MHALRRQIGKVRRDDTDRYFDRSVFYARNEHGHQLRQDEADYNAGRDEVNEQPDALVKPRSVARHDNGNRDLQCEQAAGVIYQAFALDDVGDPARQAEAASDGGGGDRVGSANDRAEHEALLPGEFGENPAGGEGHSVDSEADQAESQKRDARDVITEIAPGSLEGCGKKQRRKEKQEHDVRIQFDMRDARDQADEEPGDV